MESAHVFHSGGVELFNRANAGAAIGMNAEARLGHVKSQQLAIRIGQDGLAELLLHYVAFGFEVCVVDDQRAHALGFAPEHALEMVGGDGLEIVREIVPGGGVVESACIFGQPVKGFRRHVDRGLEHQVLKQVRET